MCIYIQRESIYCVCIYLYRVYIRLRPGGPPAPPSPPPPYYPVMYSYTSIGNGRRGVFSPPPPPPWNRISPPPGGTGWFSLLPYTHTPCLSNRMVFPFALRHIHTLEHPGYPGNVFSEVISTQQ